MVFYEPLSWYLSEKNKSIELWEEYKALLINYSNLTTTVHLKVDL
jgi:hypothetical protein